MDIAEFDFADDINASWTLLTQANFSASRRAGNISAVKVAPLYSKSFMILQTTEQQQQQSGHGGSLQQAGHTQEELRIQRIRDKNRRAQKR